MNAFFELIGGGILLYFGAEWFVGGASALAVLVRVSQLVIGLTVVAYGTSAPELVVSLEAARTGHGAVALGNVIGSNIANVGLILGIAVLIRPALVNRELPKRELPMLLLSLMVIPLSLWDGRIGPVDGIVLLGATAIYTVAMLRSSRGSRAVREGQEGATVTAVAADRAGGPTPRSVARSALITGVGLLVLLIGGNLFVEGSVAVARLLGMSDTLVGLTIVAVGTSLPELVTSVIAARHGHSDIAIGNVVGSNILNIFFCLGAAALFGTVSAPLSGLLLDLLALGVMTGMLAVSLRSERMISRFEGVVVLALYAAFTTLFVARG